MPLINSLLPYTIHQSKLWLTSDRMFNNVNYDLEDVSSALCAASLGTGINHFPEHLLRYAAKLLSFHLLKLLDAITSTAIFPQRWKYEVITTVYKKGMKRSITNLISIQNPDIVCLCETWFDDSFVDNNVSLNTDYVTKTRADRKTGEHGGVLILCKHTVKFEALKTSCHFACAVKLHSNQSLLTIIYVFKILREAVNTELVGLLLMLPSINLFLLTISG